MNRRCNRVQISERRRLPGFLMVWNLTGWVVLLLFLQAPQGLAAGFTGRVTDVVSGHTVVIVNEERIERVRLFGVEAPDVRARFGLEAKQFTADLVLGKEVTVELHGRDQDKQVLGEVLLEDGRALGEALVKAGLARWYRMHSKDAGVGRRRQVGAAAALERAIPRGRRAGDREIVAQGLGWWHWKHMRDQRLKGLEAQARANGHGLWSVQNLLPL